jgi:hypothetical protein
MCYVKPVQDRSRVLKEVRVWIGMLILLSDALLARQKPLSLNLVVVLVLASNLAGGGTYVSCTSQH